MKLLLLKTSGILVAGVLMATFTVPAFAQVGVYTGAGISVTATTNGTSSAVGAGLHARIGAGVRANATGTAMENRETQAETRSTTEITNRIDAMNALQARINAMIYVTSTDKADLSTALQAQVSALTSLQSKIAADVASNATATLKIDIQSITGAYRIYALVDPQATIAAASDRAQTLVAMFQTLGGKLQTRISAAQASGTNVTAMQSAYTDFSAKIADAQVQAQAAVSETVSLQPDNGNATILASNTAALKDARAKLKVAQQDLVAARKDAGTIVKDLAAIKISVSANATTSVTTGGNQ